MSYVSICVPLLAACTAFRVNRGEQPAMYPQQSVLSLYHTHIACTVAMDLSFINSQWFVFCKVNLDQDLVGEIMKRAAFSLAEANFAAGDIR